MFQLWGNVVKPRLLSHVWKHHQYYLKTGIGTQRKSDSKTKENRRHEKEKCGYSFFENVKDHDNIFIRYTARFFYYIWLVVLAIGSFLALVISYISA